VLGEPVAGSGYWWYRIELGDPDQSLVGGVRDGWVAAGDHDGTPWIDWLQDVDPGPPSPEPWSAWPAVLRDGVRLGATTDQSGQLVSPVGDDGGLSIPIEISGLLPGTGVTITATGHHDIRWVCTFPDPSAELGGGYRELAWSRGTVDERVDVDIGPDGIGRLTVTLTPPPQQCPAEEGPLPIEVRWSEIRVEDLVRGLVLTPEDVRFGITF
jgi:hypothetical protein